jgi:hypothetical protein
LSWKSTRNHSLAFISKLQRSERSNQNVCTRYFPNHNIYSIFHLFTTYIRLKSNNSVTHMELMTYEGNRLQKNANKRANTSFAGPEPRGRTGGVCNKCKSRPKLQPWCCKLCCTAWGWASASITLPPATSKGTPTAGGGTATCGQYLRYK